MLPILNVVMNVVTLGLYSYITKKLLEKAKEKSEENKD